MREIHIDLFRDWIQSCRRQLLAWGYTTLNLQTDRDIAHCYLNIEWRKIRRGPRAILKARDFTCPIDKTGGLANLERKIEAGEDLLPHLSRGLTKADYNDALLNDWGICHLHLGTKLDKDGFVERRGTYGNLLLFACFDDSIAYFLCVMEHGKWSNQSMVQTLHDNWPSLIESARLKNVSGKESSLTDDEVKIARAKGLTIMVQVADGTIYLPLAGGYSSCGLSSMVVRETAQRKRILDAWTQGITEQIEGIAVSQGITLPDRLTFELQVENGDAQAFERGSRIAVPLGKLWN